MKSRNSNLFTVATCALALALWHGPPLRAQPPAPEPEGAAPIAATFRKGPLAPDVAEKVRTILSAQLKASLPPPEEGTVELRRVEKGILLTATVDGQKYAASVFRPFVVEPLHSDEGGFAAKEYYVRTTAPWKLRADLVIPADVYLSATAEQVSAYDAGMIAAQDEAIARSEALSKAALGQVEYSRKANWARVVKAQKSGMDLIIARITQLTSEMYKKQEQRKNVTAQVLMLQTPALMNGQDAAGNVIWDWNGTKLSFYDNLDQVIQSLAMARDALTTMEQERAAAASPGSAATSRAIRTVLSKHQKLVFAGEAVGEKEMRQDYEAALGEALNVGATVVPDASKTKTAAGAAPRQ